MSGCEPSASSASALAILTMPVGESEPMDVVLLNPPLLQLTVCCYLETRAQIHQSDSFSTQLIPRFSLAVEIHHVADSRVGTISCLLHDANAWFTSPSTLILIGVFELLLPAQEKETVEAG